MPNFRPGVDDNPADYMYLVKVNIPFDDRAKVIAVLEAVQAVQADKLSPTREFSSKALPGGSRTPRLVVADFRLGMLVAFGLPFFLGPIGSPGRLDEQAIQNFPPGGSFIPRVPTRFGMQDRVVPLYLRTMNAAGDQGWIAAQLAAANNGQAPSADDVNTAYANFLKQGEADLFFQVECEYEFLAVDLLDALRARVIDAFGLQLVSIQRGVTRGDGKAHIGFFDGTSNLQHMMRDDPLTYRSKIYLPTPSAAYPGQPIEVRDDPRYDGGTYLVYRKYLENLDKWYSDDFTVKDFFGNTYTGDQARLHAIGRSPHSGNAVSRASHKELNAEPDHAEINLGFNEAHALKARGGQTAPFMGPFPPAPVGHSNAFNTQDVRIRRRGLAFSEVNPHTAKVEYGLHFICFQNNIQQTGFEFINNIWLINPDFRRSTDGLMNPVGEIIAPLEGAYFFVPPEQHSYPGDVFFE
jgi:deferrochelatase/peroxidase EfeB